MISFRKFAKLEYHKTLNPKVWEPNDILNSDVRQHLLAVAEKWLVHAKIPNEAVLDYLLTGGAANYNYTPASDLDVHILVDPAKLPIQDADMMHDIIMDKKNSWAAKHNITIRGMPVEVYAQMTTETIPVNQGVYSLGKNQWVIKPTFLDIKYTDKELHRDVFNYKDSIDQAIENDNLELAKSLKDQITGMRSVGLKRGGEFDALPTAFKALRNSGYLSRLVDYIANKEDSELSLEQVNPQR